jgi:hypothetical protein
MKVHSAWSFLNKKYSGENAVLPEEKLDEIRARLEHCLANPSHSYSRGTGFDDKNTIVTETLLVLLFKIGQVQASEDGDYEKMHFVTGFCEQYVMIFLTQNFFTGEALFHLRGIIRGQNNRYWQSIYLRQTFKVSLHRQKIGGCCVP